MFLLEYDTDNIPTYFIDSQYFLSFPRDNPVDGTQSNELHDTIKKRTVDEVYEMMIYVQCI